MTSDGLTRRDFLKIAAIAPFADAAFGAAVAPAPAQPRVVLIRDKNAVDSQGAGKPEVIQAMMDQAITALTGEKNALDGWKGIVSPSDTVGIKTNVWNYLPTGSAVEQALKKRIVEAGVSEEKIGIDDRGVRNNPLFTNATALINARPARTHYWAGMGSCIKNMIMFSDSPPSYHADTCADLALLWNLPAIKGKVRLNVLVMLTPLFHGVGPHHFSAQYVWTYGGLIVGRDPVAVDATGVRILEAKRREFFGEERPLQPPAKHVFLADTRHKLGVSGADQIELIKFGWSDGILI